jgi:ectoine hydroxylase-related dioxygenase (phytanoyl-CoA dioxygenase family)
MVEEKHSYSGLFFHDLLSSGDNSKKRSWVGMPTRFRQRRERRSRTPPCLRGRVWPPCGPGADLPTILDVTDADEIAVRLERDGYAVIPGLLGLEAVAAARAELDPLLDTAEWGTGFDGTRTKRAWAPLAVTRRLDQAALAPVVLDSVERVIGPGTQFGISCAIQVHPGQQAQVLHYDQGIYPLPRDRDVMITTLWALDDFTAANGATRFVPGSHLRPAGKPDADETIPAEMPAGSVLLFVGRLYHGAGANTTSRPRLGVVIDYVQPWLRPCEAHTLSASHEQVRQLPQRLQELLGFNQPTPYLGFVNGRHPRDWLMNDQQPST